MEKRHTSVHKHRTSFQIIILGFLAMILLGSLLLMLPFATRSGQGAGFTDALFTATSAVCVTGLVLHDTATYWSLFGQAVILLMIQVGGMGIVTVAVAVASISGRKIGLMQRSAMQEAVSAPHVGGIVRLTKFILKVTLCVELLGALLLAPFFCRDFDVPRGLWYALFHAVSAFCNAGFDLTGTREPFSSLTGYAASPAVNGIIMALILIGGIGFLTWEDIKNQRFHFRRYRMQSKVILTVSGLLILLPATYFFFFEYGTLPLSERLLCSLFQAVTPRTAGFNTTDLSAFSETGQMVVIGLMLVGGSPGSTAGGMKTTTLAVLVATAFSVFRKREHTQLFRRRLSNEAVRSAVTVLLMYVGLCVGSALIISRLEGLPLLSVLFETASAIGTVGLSLGVTGQLGLVSQLLLIGLMFCGRVGGLTLVFAAMSPTGGTASQYPQEKITVG